MRIYMELFFKNIARRWGKEVSYTKKLIILSPYVTSSTAEAILKNANANKCELYTLFSAELFINGGSSISTLINIKESGIKLYLLEKLHAKVFLIPGVFASIGSQNLTLGGTKNLESSVIIKNKEDLCKIEIHVSEWTKNRVEITLPMLIDMRDRITPLITRYKEIINDAYFIDKQINERHIKENTFTENDLRLRKLKKAITNSKKSKISLLCRVAKIEPSWSSFSDGRHSLLPNAHNDLTVWKICNNEEVNLERTSRYICIIKNTGKLAWSRVVKTRISYFSKSVTCSDNIKIGNSYCNLEFKALWEAHELLHNNLIIKLSPIGEKQSIFCKAWFNLSGLIINEVKPDLNLKNTDIINDIIDWIKENNELFVKTMLENLLPPFKYTEKLIGVEANTFFGNVGTQVSLRLSIVHNHPLLIATIPLD